MLNGVSYGKHIQFYFFAQKFCLHYSWINNTRFSDATSMPLSDLQLCIHHTQKDDLTKQQYMYKQLTIQSKISTLRSYRDYTLSTTKSNIATKIISHLQLDCWSCRHCLYSFCTPPVKTNNLTTFHDYDGTNMAVNE